MNELRGTVSWSNGQATATIGDKAFVFAEKDPEVTNQCIVTDPEGNEIAHSTQESGFMKGITETLYIAGEPSGLTLKRGMLNTNVTWQGETKLLALGINPEPYPDPDTDEEDQDDAEGDANEIIETRHFLIGAILLEHADNTSDIQVRGLNATETLIASFLAFRIWAKNYERG